MNAKDTKAMFEKIYKELRSLAARRMAGERIDHTLQPTALIHEVFLRLSSEEAEFDNTGHFYALAAMKMQHVLVDHARARNAKKRRRRLKRVPLSGLVQTLTDPAETLALAELLSRLEALSQRKAQLVRLRVFAGCNMKEAAEILGISRSTANDDWAYARAWLRREWLEDENLEGGPESPG